MFENARLCAGFFFEAFHAESAKVLRKARKGVRVHKALAEVSDQSRRLGALGEVLFLFYSKFPNKSC